MLTSQDDELRIVILGKTGVGKSASGNTILRREAFKDKFSPSSVTQICAKQSGKVAGREVVVIDTPGLFETELNNSCIIHEILKCISLTSPGPHVFLVVIKVGKFTQEERETVKLIQDTFGEKASDYTMVLFTRGDQLGDKTIQDFIKGNRDLTEFVSQCRGGHHIFNNKNSTDCTQVTELLKKMEKMVQRNGGGCFTNELYSQVEAAITEYQNKILKERGMEIERQEKELEERYQGEELEQAKRALQEREGRRARAEAEKENTKKMKKMFFIITSGVSGLGVAIAAGVEFGTAVGLLGGPAGMAVGAV
ncbi:GTPase IMAP family member 9 [Amia ocellicauda]|uniref:GTPase IMAP family member 9 n=1 Tax=Amia ocellicauda TaxID=2972642 RepID=UPI003464701B